MFEQSYSCVCVCVVAHKGLSTGCQATSGGKLSATVWQRSGQLPSCAVPIMGPLLVAKKRREKHVAQPCVTPFRSHVWAVACGPKSGTVCSPNGATMHATIVRCAHAHVQLVRQSFCCVAKNTLSEHRSLCYLSQPCPFCMCNLAVIVAGNVCELVATDCAEPSACAATPLLDTSVWVAMARPCARRSIHKLPAAAAVVGLAHRVQGPAGPLNLSFRQPPAPLCFTMVWGMRHACPQRDVRGGEDNVAGCGDGVAGPPAV